MRVYIFLSISFIYFNFISADDGFCSLDAPKDCGKDESPPNVVILLADDLGYGDLSSYGHPSQESNAIDDLARDGLRFTQFYSADSMCTPARAALLTGRLPIRTGMTGGRRVMVDYDTGGLPRQEWTLAEMFAKAGYSTGMTGKWHLGINKEKRNDGYHLPNEHGFQYVGWNLPMTHLWNCDDTNFFSASDPEPTKCFLYYGREMKSQPYHTEKLADQLDESWHEFLDQQNNAEKPFFFYYSFPHVHASQWPTKKTEKPSRRGRFGDAINEMAWSVDRVRQSLTTRGLINNTMIIFLSDHGPQRELCAYGGSTGGLRGGKSNAFEGGYRIPSIVHWPARVKGGVVSNAVLSSMDILPSLAQLIVQTSEKGKYKSAKSLYSSVRHYDGIQVLDHLLGDNLDGDHLAKERPLFYYCNKKLMAVRWAEYKIHYIMVNEFDPTEFGILEADRHCMPGGKPLKDSFVSQTCKDSEVTELDEPIVFNLHIDPYEQFPLERAYISDVLKQFERVLERHQESIDLEDETPEQMGNFNANVIPCCNYPKCQCD